MQPSTLYLQKFDVDSSEAGLYWHQYQQNVLGAQTAGTNLRNLYLKYDKSNTEYYYDLALYHLDLYDEEEAEKCST